MSARQLHSWVAVHIGQQAQTETLRVGRVCKAVHRQWGLRGVEDLSHPLVQLIVGNGAPEGRLTVCHWLKIWEQSKNTFYIKPKLKNIRWH